MSVPNELYKDSYVGRGDTGPYAITFDVNLDDSGNAEDIVVKLLDPAGAETDITSSSTITGLNVYTTATYGATYTVVVIRYPALIQPSVFPYGTKFPSRIFEKAIDRLCYQVQRLNGETSLSIRVPISESSPDRLPTVAIRANKFLAFDSLGKPIAADAVAVPVTPFMVTVLDDPTAAVARLTLGVQKFLRNMAIGRWSTSGALGIGTVKSLCCDPATGRVVAVSNGSTNASYSPDGYGWTGVAIGEANTWESVCYGHSMYVAVSSDGTNRIAYSTLGVTWTLVAAPVANQWKSICYSPSLSLFCAVSDDGATYRVMTSLTGLSGSWTQRVAPLSAWKKVIWVEELGLFVAVATSGTDRVMTSADGINWDGHTAAAVNTWNSVCWSPTLGLLVAVSSDGTYRVMTSSDGSTWSPYFVANAFAWEDVAWSEELQIFLAIASSGTAPNMVSPDGVTWRYIMPSPASAYGVYWNPYRGFFQTSTGAFSSQGATDIV